jgi:hypothetical protein
MILTVKTNELNEREFIAHTRVREQHSTTVIDLFCLVLVRLFCRYKARPSIKSTKSHIIKKTINIHITNIQKKNGWYREGILSAVLCIISGKKNSKKFHVKLTQI